MRVLHLSRRRLLPALLLVPAALAAVLFFVLRTSSHRPNSIPVPAAAPAGGSEGQLRRLRRPAKGPGAALCRLRRTDRMPLYLPPDQLSRRAHGRPGQPPPVRLCRYRRGCDAPGHGRRAVLLGFSEVTPRYSSRIRTAQGQTDHRRRRPRWMEIRRTCGRADVGIGPYESVCRGRRPRRPVTQVAGGRERQPYGIKLSVLRRGRCPHRPAAPGPSSIAPVEAGVLGGPLCRVSVNAGLSLQLF